MLLAGIIENDDKTTNLIYKIMSSNNKKVVVTNYCKFMELSPEAAGNYISELSENNIDIFLLRINLKTMDITNNNIHLDFIVFGDKESQSRFNFTDQSRKSLIEVFGILGPKGIVIVNVDNTELLELLKGMKLNTITYGFNSKASMTTSSTGDGVLKDSFICCLQRTLTTREGFSIEPQEYKIKLPSNEYDAYSLLAAATFAAVNDIDLNQLKISDPTTLQKPD